MDRYPAWLVGDLALALYRADNHACNYAVLAEAALDALHFGPSYQAFKRANRVRVDTDTWEGSAQSPEVRERRRKALDEIARLGAEHGYDDEFPTTSRGT